MKPRSQENRTNHRETQRAHLRRLLEHRMEVARANGDTTLIQQLEAEYRQLSL